MDFKKILSTTRKYNFHSHTQFCDGHASIQEMAAAAVKCGMEHYGFTPHSPIIIPSPCNMSYDSVEKYISQVKALSHDPALSSCRFYTSMEIDYLNDDCGPAAPYFQQLPLDYRLASVHFVPTPEGDFADIDGKYEHFKERMERYFRSDIDYVVDTFFSQSQKMIAAGGFDILGHFDKIAGNAAIYAPGIEDSELYRNHIAKLIDLIVERNIMVELNTKARLTSGRFFPAERYLGELVRRGVTIIVNSDAHYPDKIEASRAEAFNILDSYAKS